MIQMTVLAAAFLIICIVFAFPFGFIKPIITGVAPENIFGTRLNRMQFSNRSGIVHLEGLFHRIRLSVRMEILQCQFFDDIQFILIRLDVQISIIGIIRLRLRVDLIRKGNHPFFVLSGSTLIVYISVDGIP